MLTTLAEKTLTINDFLALHPTVPETAPENGNDFSLCILQNDVKYIL